jgi:hypothetical protein
LSIAKLLLFLRGFGEVLRTPNMNYPLKHVCERMHKYIHTYIHTTFEEMLVVYIIETMIVSSHFILHYLIVDACMSILKWYVMYVMWDNIYPYN